jgi:cephalosporin hydroxylase
MQLLGDIGPQAVICEVGVLRGDSLSMWKELVPFGVIIGIDNDAGAVWPAGTHRIVAEQDDPELGAKVAALAPAGCHLIVDDASHIGHLSAATFAALWPLVRPGGYYVVEDWADRWVFPERIGWADVDPKYIGDELTEYVPELIKALNDGARTVTYTHEGLAIIQRSA